MRYKRVLIKLKNDQELVVLLKADFSLAEGFDWQGFVDEAGKTMWVNKDNVLYMKELAFVEKYW